MKSFILMLVLLSGFTTFSCAREGDLQPTKEQVMSAINHPGEIIFFDSNRKFKKIKNFSQATQVCEYKGIVFKNNKINYVSKAEEKTKSIIFIPILGVIVIILSFMSAVPYFLWYITGSDINFKTNGSTSFFLHALPNYLFLFLICPFISDITIWQSIILLIICVLLFFSWFLVPENQDVGFFACYYSGKFQRSNYAMTLRKMIKIILLPISSIIFVGVEIFLILLS